MVSFFGGKIFSNELKSIKIQINSVDGAANFDI